MCLMETGTARGGSIYIYLWPGHYVVVARLDRMRAAMETKGKLSKAP